MVEQSQGHLMAALLLHGVHHSRHQGLQGRTAPAVEGEVVAQPQGHAEDLNKRDLEEQHIAAKSMKKHEKIDENR